MKVGESKDSKKGDGFFFVTSKIFEDNIERVWTFLRDLSYSTFSEKIFEEFKYRKGNNSWTLGNVCSINWIGVSRIVGKCKEIKDNQIKKLISWEMNAEIGINYQKTYCLYRISDCDKTLVRSIIQEIPNSKDDSIKNEKLKKYYISLQESLLTNFANHIKKSKNNLNSYGSCIVNEKFSKTWKIMSDVKTVSNIVPIIGTKFSYQEPALHVGSFWKYFSKKNNKFIFLKLIEIKMPQKKNTWSYALETIGADKNILQERIKITVIKVGENKSQISIFHTFNQLVTREYLKLFEINKREVLKQIKNYIEESDNKDYVYKNRNSIIELNKKEGYIIHSQDPIESNKEN